MNMNRFFGYCAICALLTGCAGSSSTTRHDWFSEYGTMATSAPAQMQYGSFDTTADAKRMAVLLPMTGSGATAGHAVRTAVETAVLQNGPQNLSVTFYDTAPDAAGAINAALGSNPGVIVGPIFAGDARTLRAMKPDELAAISFTSDATAIGNGVMTMALMPVNSIEAIVREMPADGVTGIVLLAPDTDAGRMMAGAARAAATTYEIPVSGLFYYTEKDSESIKNTGHLASMNAARTAANTRAREILSDILTTEQLTALERSSISNQLNNLSKTETIGKLPYNAVLFLGGADDAKSLASFLRYYGVGTKEARFYGTALWDGTDISRDFTMSGARFATLPEISTQFAGVYETVSGTSPTRLATFGYDATNLAIGMLYSDQSNAQYLLNPGGYVGIDGLVRLRPAGNSQRALRIVELNGTGDVHTIKPAPTDFITPIYNVEPHYVSPAREMTLESTGINPMDHINIPQRLRGKYKSKTYGAAARTVQKPEVVAIIKDEDSVTISDPNFTPVAPEAIGRTYIDSVEISE